MSWGYSKDFLGLRFSKITNLLEVLFNKVPKLLNIADLAF